MWAYKAMEMKASKLHPEAMLRWEMIRGGTVPLAQC